MFGTTTKKKTSLADIKKAISPTAYTNNKTENAEKNNSVSSGKTTLADIKKAISEQPNTVATYSQSSVSTTNPQTNLATMNVADMNDAQKALLKNQYESLDAGNAFKRLWNMGIRNEAKLYGKELPSDYPDYNKAYIEKQQLSKNYKQIKSQEAHDKLLANGMTEQELKEAYHNILEQDEIDDLYAKGMTEDEVTQYADDLYDRGMKSRDKLYNLTQDLKDDDVSFDDYMDMLSTYYDNPAIIEDAKNHPVANSIFSVVTNPIESAAAVGKNVWDFATGKPIRRNDTYTDLTRQTVNDEIKNPVGRFAYNAGLSTADSAYAQGIGLAIGGGAGKYVGAGVQGVEKASNVMNDAVDKDLTPNRIMMQGAASGLTTFLSELIPMGKLSKIADNGLSKYTAKELAKVITSQMATEGIQEGVEDIFDWIADGLIAWDKNDIKLSIDNYMSEGDSKNEAILKTVRNKGLELFQDMLAGAISGGVMGGTTTAAAYGMGKVSSTPSVQTDVVMNSDEAKTALTEAAKTLDTESLPLETEEDLDYAIKVEHAKEVANKPVGELTNEDIVDMSNAVQEQATPENNLAQTINEINYRANYDNAIEQYKQTGTIERNENESRIESSARQLAEVDIKQAQKNYEREVKKFEETLKKSQTRSIEEASEKFENDAAARIYMDNYDGQNVLLYTKASYQAYRAGELGQTFEDYVDNSVEAKLMLESNAVSESYLKTLYYNGINSRTEEYNEVQNVGKNANRGKLTGQTEGVALNPLFEAAAKKIGYEIFIGDDTASNGSFEPSKGRMTLNKTTSNIYTTFGHENAEFMRAFAPKEMANIDKVITKMIAAKVGEKRLTEAIDVYKNAYRTAGENAKEGSSLKNEANKTFAEAREEFINDVISYILSTEEGVKTVVDYLMSDNETSAEEKVSTIQAIKNWIDNLIKTIKDYLSKNKSHNVGYQYGEELELTAEKLESISRMLVGVLDTARENLAKMSEGQSTKTENKEAHSVEVYEKEGKIYLPKDMDSEYLQSGDRKNKNRARAYDEVKIIVLSSREELLEFLNGSDKYADTVAVGVVSDDLAKKIDEKSNGIINVEGYFIELENGHTMHLEEKHTQPAEEGDLPLSINELADVIERINDAGIIDAIKYNSGEKIVRLAVKMDDGYVVLVEVASKSTNGLKLKTSWKNSVEKFQKKFGKIYEAPRKNEVLHKSNRLNTAESESSSTVRDNSVFNNNIPNSSENSKTQDVVANSLKVDSEGHNLTENQQEFFKDSKARDKNGNLLVLYHGSKTPEKFTVFENRPAVNGRQLGDGFYFTTDKKMAENWGRGGHDGKPNVYKVYLNIKNPFIISDNIKVTQDMIDFAKNEESQVFERALANAESEEEREMLRKNESTLKKNAERMAKEAENYTTAQFYGWYGKKYVSEAGYDGLILKAEENSDLYKAYGDQYVVFDANQIKKTTNKKPTENDDIRFSLDVPVEEKAKEHFGTTEDFQIAGYLLTDGTMLDFSGSHWMEGASAKEIADWRRNNHFRQVDHEDIYEVMESSGDNRKQFMDRGNIRLSPEAPGFNISSRKEPTAAQYRMLKEFIREVKNNPEYDADRFYVDIETNKPNKIIYENNLNEDRIINDIKSYFETGEMPKQSTLDQFRYSLDVKYNDAYANNDTETMDKLVKQAAEKAGYDSPMLYHGTMDFGFTQIDLDKMDDKMSFFATDNLSIASSYAGTNKARGINESNVVSSENIVDALEELGRWKDIREFREGDEESRKEYLEEQFKRMYDFVHKNEKEMWNRKLMNDYNEFSNTLATQIMFNNIDDKQLNKLLKPLKDAHFVISDYAYAIHNALLLLRREGLSQNTYMLDGIPKTERSVRELYLPEEYQGIYKLYANTDNLLEIDGKGDNWNNIRVETEKKSYTLEELVEMMKERKNMFSDVSYDEESGLFSYNGVQRDKEFVERVLGVTDMHQSKYENLSTREIAQRANEQGYDGVIIRNITDDGGKSNSFKHYNEHGNIYIFFNPQEQVKSADTVTYDNEGNVIPLSKRFNKENDDIRYSIDVPAENVQNHDYSYETLKKKDPIPVNDVMDMGLKTIYVSKEVSSADLAAIVRENIEKYNDGNGLGNNKLYNNDLGSFVLIGHDGIKHNKNIISEGPVDALTSLPAFFKDAIVFNEMDGKKKGADLAYVLFGAYNNEEGTQIARVVVNHFEGENVIAEIENKLYAATKRTDVSRAESAPLIGEYSPSVSKLTITQLLNAVKRTFPNDLSEDVANHLHYKRERSDLGDTRYSIDVDAFMDAFEEIDNQVNLNENELHDLIKNRMDLESDVSKKMIKDVVSNIKKQYNSGIDKAELERGITTVFRYLKNTARYSMEDVMTVMTDIAKPVLENVKTASPEQEKLYKDFTDFVKGYKISLDADQMQEVRNEFGSYTEFKRMMSGKMKLDKNGTRLDDVWTEIADRSNGKLSYGTNPNDQPVELARYILGLNPTYQTLQGQSLDSAATDLALEIFRQFYVQQSMTDAAVKVKDEMAKRSQTMKERYQGVYNAAVKQVEYERSLNMKRLAEEIDNLTAEEQEAIRTGDTINQALIENIKSEYQKRYDRLKAESVEKIARAKANYQNAYINKNLRRERSELKNRLLREVKALQNIIAHPQEGATKHVPINLIKPTIEMLEAINLDNGGSNKAIVDRLKKMSEVYESFKNNEAYSFDYDERIANDIKELQEMFENRSYVDLGIRELERVIEIVTALKTQIKNANNLILQGKLEDAKKAADNAMERVEGSRRYDNGFTDALNRYGNIHLNAYREFRKLSGYKDGSLMKIYRDLDEGSKREMQIQKNLGEIFQDVLEGQKNQKEVKKFISTIPKDLVDIGITDKNGKPILITRAMRMSLIMHSMNAGNMRHILGSGITVPNMEYFAKGKLDEAYAKGTNYRFVDYNELLQAIQKNDTNKINELTTAAQKRIEEMKKDLSPWEQRFLADAEEMFHEKTGKIINDVSMKLKGYALARVKNYFPIKTDPHFTQKEWSGLVQDGSLEGSGFLKERVISTKPILLEDITNVVERQTKSVAKYGGFAIPVRNFETIMKQTKRNQSTGQLRNLAETIDNVWGASDTKWLRNLMQDIQSGRREADSWIANFFTKLRGNFAGATLNMNLGVAIKQAASYPTAAAVTGWKPLLKNVPNLVKGFRGKGIAELEAINPLLWYRLQGYGSQDLADAKSSDLMKKFSPGWQKALGWTQLVDTGTVRSLEYAAKIYVDDNFKNLEQGSEEYWQKVSDVFTSIVEETQPNYSKLQQADVIRNPNALNKMLVMFKTQPMQNFGIVYDAVGELNAAMQSDNLAWRKEASSKVAKAVSSQVVSATVFSIMSMVANVLKHRTDRYKDEDDEWDPLKILREFGLSFASCLVGGFIGGSLIYEGVSFLIQKLTQQKGAKFYGLEVSAVEVINDLVTNCGKAFSAAGAIVDAKTSAGKEEAAKKTVDSLMSLAETVGEYTGIPARNIKQLILATMFYSMDAVEGVKTGDFQVSADKDLLDFWIVENQYKRIFEATVDGDTEKAEKLTQQLVKQMMYDKKDELEAGNITEDAIIENVQSNILSKYKSLIKEDFMEGDISFEEAEKYLEDTIGQTEDEAYMQIKQWQGGGSSEYDYAKDVISEAAANPTPENRKKVIEESQGLIEHGKKKDKYRDSLKKTFADEYRSLYKIDKAADLNAMLRAALTAAGYTDAEAKEILESWLN